MTSAEIFEKGYAIPLYDIRTCTQTFRYRDEDFNVPADRIPMHDIGEPFRVARIEDVRKAAK